MGRAPGDLLDLDPHAGMLGLEVAHQFLDHLALAPHGPEAQRHAAVARRMCAAAEERPQDEA